MRKYTLASLIVSAICALLWWLFGSNYMSDYITISSKADFTITVSIFVFMFFFLLIKGLENNTDTMKQSSDKVKTLQHAPSKEYLSKIPNGLTVGKFGSKYVSIPFKDSPEHQLIIGAPGDGKSTTIESAIIYDQNFASPKEKLCSILAVDVKPELSRKGVYEGQNNIRVINPSVIGSCGFDIFYGLTSETSDDALYDRFSMIANTVIKDSGSDNTYFSEAARNIFTAFLMYGFLTQKNFGECINEILDAPVEDLIAQILEDECMDNHKRVKRLIREFDGKTSDGFQDVAMTLKKDLGIFDDTSVKACFAQDNPKKVSPIDLANGISIFLAIPDHLLLQYSTVFRLILNMCMSHIMSLSEANRINKRPIWVLIDEAGSIGKLPILGDVLARGRSKGIQCTLIIQSEGQLDSTYGRDMCRSIKDCCKTTIVFGSNDVPTCDGLSKRTGTYTEQKTSTTRRGGTFSGDASTNESSEYRPAVDVADIQNLSRNDKVMIFAKGDWFLCNKTPYYKIPMLHKKSVEIEQLNSEFYA